MNFKIKYGFDNQEFIRIDETEIEKAIYAQITGKVGVFNSGTVRGSNIISITADYHKEMGWNDGYELLPEDFAEMRSAGVEKKYKQVMALAKDNVAQFIQTKQEHLIGKNPLLLTSENI